MPAPPRPRSFRPALAAFLLAAVAAQAQAPGGAGAQDDPLVYQTPAPALAALVDAPQTPTVRLSPDRETMALFAVAGAPPVAELAEPELGLAGVRINPATNGPSRASGYTSLSLKPVAGGAQTAGVAREVTGFPDGARLRSPQWSPDGQRLALLADRPDRVELWTVDVASAAARPALDAAVNDAAPGASFAWLPDGRLVVRTVPGGRGGAPEETTVPTGPVVQESAGRAAPARTYQDLLASPRDEALFDYYMTSQLVVVDPAGAATPLGPEAVYASVSPSPDGRFVLTEALHAPYSYLVPWYRFPTRVEVWDLATGAPTLVHDAPLAERVPIAFGSVPTGPRGHAWRADAPATLVWAEAQDGGDAGAPADVRDRLFTLDAPFAGGAAPLVTLPLRFSGVTWGDDDTAVVEEYQWQDRTRRAYVIDPSRPAAPPRELFTVSFENRYDDPGQPMTEPTAGGAEVLVLDGTDTFWTGQGASPEGNRPFVRRLDLATGESAEVFRSQAPYYEAPVAFLDEGGAVLLTRRETVTAPPNFVARDLATGEARALTDFPHPYPELADVQKETVEYTRADGVPLSATLYLPAGYDAERDGPLPTLVWAYPTEFKSADAAGQRSDSPYQFTRVSYWGAVPFVTQGYAVLDDASFPVVGEGEAQPNDTFREQLVMNAEAAIAAGAERGVVDPDRVAVGGHSYGAFMVGNLLAHSDLFRAGIARSGAYNRTLTPFGFQREERTFWDDPMLYVGMSPFMHADQIDEPILLIHGDADNNPGTFTLQSERLYGALKGLGGTARLVLLPAESHGYRGRESLLHMLWEEARWLDTYVKPAAPPRADGGGMEATGGR
ncbi:prolyl oligopeptidase family serine peptidase [Rubrivirga sp. S365]|uniref:Prolyl oligopeptidase family serine peptidase n=1 Tax=Rubrivirga litoralis TaxID=3075598 RepID=A0ABU3BSW1_9BACT|nr:MULTISPECIES: prolyl oligopeptidase family serine peptidase [unclassified Rubrivirga]MDT0632377.1 prolyl oligopeptidase family serine peptidase [Rubrivirga sp. F394]MDT7855252.1 prolyl oligopeptidase family serine peptidase [Rubrivirga sp. S365]